MRAAFLHRMSAGPRPGHQRTPGQVDPKRSPSKSPSPPDATGSVRGPESAGRPGTHREADRAIHAWQPMWNRVAVGFPSAGYAYGQVFLRLPFRLSKNYYP